MNERINQILTESGWIQDGENPLCYYNRAKALYVYPVLGRLKYWPDLRVHSDWHEHVLPVSRAELLSLIEKE